MTFLSQSQIDTSNDPLICFPKSTVVKIEKDLIRGDYCDSTNKAKDTIIIALKEKVTAQDSIDKIKSEQILLHKMNEQFYEQIGERKDAEIKAYKKEIRRQKFQKVIFIIGDVVIPAVAVYFTLKATSK